MENKDANPIGVAEKTVYVTPPEPKWTELRRASSDKKIPDFRIVQDNTGTYSGD